MATQSRGFTDQAAQEDLFAIKKHIDGLSAFGIKLQDSQVPPD